jgi:hypothetical protein
MAGLVARLSGTCATTGTFADGTVGESRPAAE